MDEEMLVAYEKLEAENKELKYVFNKLTHEMGNALTLLGGSIYYVEANINNKKLECDIADLKNDYTYICNLFNRLKEYNLIDSIDKKEINVEEIVKVIEGFISKLKNDLDVKFEVVEEDNILNKKIYGDIVMLQQVLVNILNNSIDAVSKNVNERKINVRITVETISDELLSDVEASGECEMIHMEVADNGKGIAEKNMDKIFEPMYTYGKKGGTGLGLAIVKKIIDKHNGKIKAVSVLGTGTAIHIYLPILFY